MKRYLNHYLRIFKLSVMDNMVHRENFFTWAAIHTISLISLIIFFSVIYQGTTNINGWTEYQSLLVLGVGTLITGLGSITFFSFMYDFGREIADGSFDMRLTKPLDIHFQSAFLWTDIEDSINIPSSLILISYSLWKLKPEHLFINVVGFAIMLASSMIILFSLLTFIQSLAFKFIKVDSVANFYWSVVNTAKYPAKAIRNVGVIASTLLIPIAIISSVPAEILFGRWEPIWIIGSISSAVVLLILSRLVFMSSLRHYSSASS